MSWTPRPKITAAVGALAVTLVASACSGAGGGAAGSTATPGTAAAATGSGATPARPAVTESNPPGDIPDNQAYVPYTLAGTTVSVKVPEGWARTATGHSTTFSDKLNQVTIAVTTPATAPTAGTVRAHDIPILQGQLPKFAAGSVTTVQRAGQSVIRLTYQADSAPNPVTGKVVRDAFERYVYYRSGERVDLTLSGPSTADNVDPWTIVSNSLRWS